MKTSVISPEFRERYLSNPGDRTRSRDARSCSTDPRTTTPASMIRSHIDERCVLFMRGTGAIGYPGGQKW